MPREELPATELKYLEDNIATVAWHLGRPGASIAVSYDNGVRLIVDAGAVLNEISRRLDPGNAQEPASVTDAMCEAALSADFADRVQGFSYEKRHVIRDVWLPPQEQELWSAPVAGPDEYQAFQKQCRIERMRRVIAAALRTSSQGASK